MKTPYVRTRMTQQTARRAANMRRLITEFQKLRRMSVSDVMKYLNMSASGTRKYLRELRDAEVVYGVGSHIFELGEQTQIENFDRSLEAPRSEAPRPAKVVAPLPRGTFLHIMGDDEFKHPRRSTFVPKRGELETYLFGPAKTIEKKEA